MSGATGLEWQTIQIPLAAGLDLKSHPQAIKVPALSKADNVEFDDVGALRLRKPYASVGTDLVGGGTLSNVRKRATRADELLCFTKDALYSWSPTLSKWASRGTHLAVKVEETTRFNNTSDQIFADRAQLNGLVAIAWYERGTSTDNGKSYVAAYDATTGTTIIQPTDVGAWGWRPVRVVATGTRILVFWVKDGTGLVVKAINPASPSFSAASPTTIHANQGRYDVEYNAFLGYCVGAISEFSGDTYSAFSVTDALAVATSDKVRRADYIAIATLPGVGTPVVARADNDVGTVVYADVLTTALADTAHVDVGLDAGTSPSTITAAFSTVALAGVYTCYVFTSHGPSGGGPNSKKIRRSTVTTAGTASAAADFLIGCKVGSRAFEHDGAIYLWADVDELNTVDGSGLTVTRLGVRAELQNTLALYRDDGHLAAKVVWQRYGGNDKSGWLPGVARISGTTGYAFASTIRGVIPIDPVGSSYTASAPRDVAFTFDSNEARRTAQLGQTLYVSGGMLLQYDGEALTEVGFMQYPWWLYFTKTAGGSTIPAGAYSYEATLRWDNATGESERSTTAVGGQVTIALNDQVNVEVAVSQHTRKTGSIRGAAIEVWRTSINPVVDSPFYLVTSRNPVTTGDNRYLSNAVGTASVTLSGDVFTDAVLETKEQLPVGLPRVAPPGCSIVVASDARLFIAGIPGEPHRIWYSLLRNDGEIASFNDALSFSLPSTTGPITGLASLNDALIAFTATAAYAIPGTGYDNIGGGSNYGTPRLISADVGATSQDTIAQTPIGIVFFSRKGWYRLTPGLDVEYIGAKVEEYNGDTWVAAQAVEAQHQIRLLSSSRMLVFDYLVSEWSEWSQTSGRDLGMWRGTPVLLDDVVKTQQATFDTVTYRMVARTGWIKPADMQGMVRIRRLMVLGEYQQAHQQQITAQFDYVDSDIDRETVTFSGLTTAYPTQVRQGVTRQRCESVRVQITILSSSAGGGTYFGGAFGSAADGRTPAYEAVRLTGLALEVGVKRGLYQRLPAAQKT